MQQQGRSQLSGTVLHRHHALGKAGQGIDRLGLGQLHAMRAEHRRLQVDGLQCAQVLRRRRFPGMHPQRHRRVGVVGFQNLLPLRGVFALQALDPPARVVPAGLGVRVGQRHQRIPLAQKTAQTGIDETGLPCSGTALGRFHRLVDQREGRIRCLGFIPRQRQCRAQQGIHLGGRGLGRQLGAQGLGPAQIAQHLEQQRLDTRAQRGRHGLQQAGARLSGADGLQGLRHLVQQP